MIEYIKRIINSDSKESSKRFIAVWTMILVTITVITSLIMTRDYVTILSVLLTFVGALVGITAWHSIKNKIK